MSGTNITLKKQRFEVPDILRGLAILFMIMIHVINMYGNEEATSGWPHLVLDFLAGPPAAPVFMFTMGFFFILKKPMFSTGIRRGIILIVTGYVLNIVKGFLPVFLAREVLGWDRSLFPDLYTNYYLILNVEILIFAGIAFILMNIISRISMRPVFFIALACLFMAISPFLWGLGSDIPVIKHLVLPLWGADTELVIFPVFPWIVYPLLGMASAMVFKDQKSPSRLYLLSGLFGVVLMAVGGTLLLIDFERFFHDYGQQAWGAVCAFSGFIFLWGMFIMFINKIMPSFLKMGFLSFLSKNITTVYIIQWILIGWLILCIPLHSVSLFGVCVVFICITIISCILTAIYNKIRA